MRYIFYSLLEALFTILWIPFGIGHFILASLAQWTYKKKFNIWAKYAAKAIAYNNKEIKKERQNIE